MFRRRFALVCLVSAASALPAAGLEVVYVARHAQKSQDTVWDGTHGKLRPLTEKGARCAAALAAEVAPAGVVAAYASETVRTLATALAVSSAGDAKAIGDDDSVLDPPAFAADVRRRHGEERAVVAIGHSNTVGRLVAAFAPGAEACYEALGVRTDGTVDETRYGDLWRVELGKQPCAGGVTHRVLEAEGVDCATP